MPSTEESPAGFASYRLDSHLILNALNNLGMELYTQLGREMPAVALLADYIIAEHGAGHRMGISRVYHAVADEWNICKAILSLKASLVGVRLDFRESGDLAGLTILDHALVVLLRDVFAAWPKLAQHEVRLTIQAGALRSLRLSAYLKITPSTGVRAPFLRALLDRGASVDGHLGEVGVRLDDGYGWEIDIHLPPPT